MKLVKCNICGKELKSLNLHLSRTHHIKPSEYRDLYPGAPLVDKEVSKKIGSANRSQWTPEKRKEQSKIMADRMNNVILKDPLHLERRREISRRNMQSNWESEEFSSKIKSSASRLLKEKWKDSEYRARHIELSREIANRDKARFLEMTAHMSKEPKVIEDRSNRFSVMNKENWKSSNYRKSVSERSSKNLSQTLKKMWKDPDYRERMSIQNAKTLASQGRLSSPHRLISDYLNSIGVSHINEYILEGKSFDIYLPGYNIAIEVNGEYWHGYHDTPESDMTDNQVAGYYRDLKRIDILGKDNILFLFVKRDIRTGVYEELIKIYLRNHNVSFSRTNKIEGGGA